MVGCDQCGHWDEFIACAGLFAGMPAKGPAQVPPLKTKAQ